MNDPPFAELQLEARHELQFRKWRIIHKYVHDHPFATNPALSRSRQWRAVVDYARDIGEIEVLDWVLEQIDVAEHIENGIRDMRPRKSGPCHPLLLEYVANRKRKAFAAYRFVRAAEKIGEELPGSRRSGAFRRC